MAARWIEGIHSFDDDPGNDATIVVQPLGATEQHGPHLPLNTDTLIARGVVDRLIQKLNAQNPAMDIRFLPVNEVGYSPEHMDFEGSQTEEYDNAINAWVAYGTSCSLAGANRFVLLNAHGGNSPLVSIAMQEIRVTTKSLAVGTKWDRFVKGSGIVSDNEEAFGIHGGDIETSVMLALHPELVDVSKVRDFPNLQEVLAQDFKHLRAYGPHAFGWKAGDLNKFGVTGNAAMATAEKGEALLALAVQGLSELLDDVARFDLALLNDP